MFNAQRLQSWFWGAGAPQLEPHMPWAGELRRKPGLHRFRTEPKGREQSTLRSTHWRRWPHQLCRTV